jgi:3-hydroxyacyl-CoA dehydrogenase
MRNVLVCGAGLMGHGIAQVMAATGHNVALYEPDTSRAEAGRDRIAGNLDRAVAKDKISQEERDQVLGRVSVASDLATAARSAELVVEAVFEDEAVKQKLFAEIAMAAPESAILASNTSSIAITGLCLKGGVATLWACTSSRPSRSCR